MTFQKFSQKYAIAALLESGAVGDEFSASAWPLHVTLADVFAVKWSEAKAQLAQVATQHVYFDVAIIGATRFGEKADVPVVLLEKTTAILELHEAIMRALELDGVVFNVPEYTHAGFVPHMSVGNDPKKLHIGQNVAITNITIIDMFPDNDPFKRRIIEVYNLKKD